MVMNETTPAAPSAPGTLLLLVRHGETPTTGTMLPGRVQGLHPSGRGRDQAGRLAERMEGLQVDAIYSYAAYWQLRSIFSRARADSFQSGTGTPSSSFREYTRVGISCCR